MAKNSFKLRSSGKSVRLMQDFNITKADLGCFEQEYLQAEPLRLGKVILTESWMYSANGCLLPLKEVVWINYVEKLSRRQFYNSHYYIRLYFRNGARFCFDIQVTGLNYMLKLLAERCPNAEFGTYTWKRKRAWKQSAKQWRAAHR